MEKEAASVVDTAITTKIKSSDVASRVILLTAACNIKYVHVHIFRGTGRGRGWGECTHCVVDTNGHQPCFLDAF